MQIYEELCIYYWAAPIAQLVEHRTLNPRVMGSSPTLGICPKNLPAMQETWVQSLGREDPLKKEMAISFSISGNTSGVKYFLHSSILAWQIAWTEEPGGLQSMGLQRVGHNWVTDTFNPALICDCLGGMPLVCSESPHMDHIIGERVYNL